MDALIIDATEDTPLVKFDPENENFILAERSLPENAIEFYHPIFEWLKNYTKNPNPITKFNFKLEYFTTSSAKQIIKILLILQDLAKNSDVTIRWHYRKEDIDMYSSGLKYEKLINANFEMIEY